MASAMRRQLQPDIGGLDELVEHEPVGDAGAVAAEGMTTRRGGVRLVTLASVR